jgi:alanyl-tRNA synthetase
LTGARRAAERLHEAGEGERQATKQLLGDEAERLVAAAEEVDGISVVSSEAALDDQKQMLELANRIQSKLGGESAVVLGSRGVGKSALVALITKEAVSRGLSAAEIIREVAPIVGVGVGGRDDMAQAGGKTPEKLDEALDAARRTIEKALA